MPRITFVQPDGETISVEADAGTSIMRIATDNGITGIVAECGGTLSCSTCHAYIDEAWLEKLPAPSEEELVMVDCAIDVRSNSRLACQIEISDELDGIVVRIPESQY